MEVRFLTLHYYWAEKYSLHRGLRYMEVHYIEVRFHTLHYYWAEKYHSLHRGLRYMEVPLYVVKFRVSGNFACTISRALLSDIPPSLEVR